MIKLSQAKLLQCSTKALVSTEVWRQEKFGPNPRVRDSQCKRGDGGRDGARERRVLVQDHKDLRLNQGSCLGKTQ